MRTTVGQILVNDALPENLRDYNRVIDKKSIIQLLHDVFVEDADQYRDIAQKLSDIGREVSYRQGSSLSLDSLKTEALKSEMLEGVRQKILTVMNEVPDVREQRRKIKQILEKANVDFSAKFYEKALAEENPFAIQVFSGARGNKSQLASTIGSLVSAPDARGETVPIPILHGYSDGLSPAEHWASAYGARRGMVDVKFATADAGYLGKQFSQASHRLVVTEEDCGTTTGIPVDADDRDNVGAHGPYKAGTIITPTKLKVLAKLGAKTGGKIVVRSPITCQSEHGLCQHCSGVRERGTLPPIGDIVGISSASAITERLSQGMLAKKHGATGGGGTSISGFDYIRQLTQVPKHYKGGATHAEVDGTVSKVEAAPQGGQFIYVGDTAHYVNPDHRLDVRVGSHVEAGDVMTEGIPNPSKIVQHKGIGEGRLYFAKLFKKAFEEAGHYTHRRNSEMLARAIINHVRATDFDASYDTLPDDVMEYDKLQRNYSPRHGSSNTTLAKARGLYLEQPVLHYSIGTRITPRVLRELKSEGYKSVMAHREPPSFVPEMHRVMDSLGLTPDWLVQQGGVNIGKRLRESVHRGASSDIKGTSYIPKMVTGEI